jgi:IS1 family transposase/transposase-like protein
MKKSSKVFLLDMKTTKERCPYCLGSNLRPKGWNRKRTKRRKKCADCKRHITQGGKSWFVGNDQIELVGKLLLERISLRGICRVMTISLSWLLAHLSALYEKQPSHLNYRMEKGAGFTLGQFALEADEMWSFVGKKANKKWIWIVQCRKTRQVVGYHVGGRGREDAQKLWDKLPASVQQEGYFYTDDWEAYKGVFPTDRHRHCKEKSETNHVERLNNTIRQRVARLVRCGLSFSKKLENHIGALKYFFCHYNLAQQQKWDRYIGAHL